MTPIQNFLSGAARYRKWLVLAAIFFVLLIGMLIFQNLRFHITSMTPDNRNYPAFLGTLEINFNKDLDEAGLKKRIAEKINSVVAINFDGDVKAVVSDKKLTLTFSRTPLPGSYEITLINIPSASGETINTTLPFIVKNIPYARMSKAEKALFDKFSSSSGEDEAFTKFPLLAKLPHETDNYRVSYRFPENDPAPTLIITMKFFAPGNNAVPATPAEQAAYLSDVRKYRKEALAWIESQSPTYQKSFTLEYTELDLREEFPAGRGRYFDGPGDPPHKEEQ